MVSGNNDNPSASEFRARYRKLLVCKEIVYKNDFANCITNDTGVLTVPATQSLKASSMNTTFTQSDVIRIDFDFFDVTNGQIEKFDEHLCAHTASLLENKIIANIKRCHKQECSECINVFGENEKVQDDFFAAMKKSYSIPCQSTVSIIKATNKIFDILEETNESPQDRSYNIILRTVMSALICEDLYSNSNFTLHCSSKVKYPGLTHQEEFICRVVDEYMKLKSNKIGVRISEEERGVYIRHSYKKRVQEVGQ